MFYTIYLGGKQDENSSYFSIVYKKSYFEEIPTFKEPFNKACHLLNYDIKYIFVNFRTYHFNLIIFFVVTL